MKWQWFVPSLILAALSWGLTGCQKSRGADGRKIPPVTSSPIPPDTTLTESEAADANAAKSVLVAYYDAINHQEYPRAYALWASKGEASGKTLEEFTSGFAKTESVQLTPGQLGRIDGAAGSRYIEIPVTIGARLSDGTEQRFRGTYTLRRSVVDGATPEQRQWRIYTAHIEEVSG